MHVRRARVDDGEALRDLRLRAMAQDPDAFGATYDENASRTPENWRTWLDSTPTFFVEEDTSTTLGLAAVIEPDWEPGALALASMWVDPIARGTGAALLLIEAVVGHCQAMGDPPLVLGVYQGNPRARRFYERTGWVATGRTWPADEKGRVPMEMVHRPADRQPG